MAAKAISDIREAFDRGDLDEAMRLMTAILIDFLPEVLPEGTRTRDGRGVGGWSLRYDEKRYVAPNGGAHAVEPSIIDWDHYQSTQAGDKLARSRALYRHEASKRLEMEAELAAHKRFAADVAARDLFGIEDRAWKGARLEQLRLELDGLRTGVGA